MLDPALHEFINRLVRLNEIVPVLEGFFRDKKKIDVARTAQSMGGTASASNAVWYAVSGWSVSLWASSNS